MIELVQCSDRGTRGPALLVLVAVFADDRVLLHRGVAPYQGQRAPPGGFVEAGESLEAAAIREVWEEAGIKLGAGAG